eukprot:CAMPEP_0115846728 /NCGR_PEP_ID=MMETSP0287-20121206/10009_1 /TAXON_ID=412157 /ORGANISM="Chrysochromulina rotalis, Strain UIO044" /LENGTH=222 /DNA_ID=CAMNT_0003300525 /DNA_START=103 /DNA_END=771 /DNA_ORIENTATION=-
MPRALFLYLALATRSTFALQPLAHGLCRSCAHALRTPSVGPQMVWGINAAVTTLLADDVTIVDRITSFQEHHTFLQGLLLTLLIRLIINEIRARVEKPVMDELGNRVGTTVARELTPETTAIATSDWAKLPLCLALDVAGDASQALPILGELTDLGFAPLEAGALKLLFKSDIIAGFGFLEEILPFTDVIPTFTISWCLANIWPTTPLARRLLGTDTDGSRM